MASIEKRGDSYQITVSVGYAADGKKVRRKITYTPDQKTATGRQKADSVIWKEVEQYAADFERQVKAGEAVKAGAMKFYELVDRYLEEYAFTKLAQRTAEEYATHLKNKILPVFGHYRLDQLCSLQLEIQKFYNNMAKPQADGKRLATASIKRSMSIFSGVLRWAVDMQLIARNPLDLVRAPRNEFKGQQVKSFTIDELKRFIGALDAPQVHTCRSHCRKNQQGTVYQIQEYAEKRYLSQQLKLFFLMAAFSGCRRGELLALDWNDLDFDQNTISLYKSVSKTSAGVIVKETKTESGIRSLYMPAAVMEFAKAWRKQQIELQLRTGSAWRGEGNVFCQADGSRMYPDTVSAKFGDIIENWNSQCKPDERLPEITLHGLRHTAASILINQKTDIATVSKRLGHSSISVTLDIYTHAIKEADKAAAAIFEGIATAAGVK